MNYYNYKYVIYDKNYMCKLFFHRSIIQIINRIALIYM